MFPHHLILLSVGESCMVKSGDQLTTYSARFEEFERIDVLTFLNRSDVTAEARYQIEDRVFLISYDTITHRFCIDAQYPPELWESDEFGMTEDNAYTPEHYRSVIAACIEDGFDPDFDPTPKIWSAEDLSQGIYSSRRDLAGGRSGSIRAVAVPSFGRWWMQEID
jgi:hypothetical protein